MTTLCLMTSYLNILPSCAVSTTFEEENAASFLDGTLRLLLLFALFRWSPFSLSCVISGLNLKKKRGGGRKEVEWNINYNNYKIHVFVYYIYSYMYMYMHTHTCIHRNCVLFLVTYSAFFSSFARLRSCCFLRKYASLQTTILRQVYNIIAHTFTIISPLIDSTSANLLTLILWLALCHWTWPRADQENRQLLAYLKTQQKQSPIEKFKRRSSTIWGTAARNDTLNFFSGGAVLLIWMYSVCKRNNRYLNNQCSFIL